MSAVFPDNVGVEDPFGVTSDRALGDIARALRPEEMEPRIVAALCGIQPAVRAARLRGIRVVRHKPGRRCLIEYTVETDFANGVRRDLTLIGKARASHRPETTFRRQMALTAAGFGEESADGISVPDAIACFPDLNLWLQRKVEGRPLTQVLDQPGATAAVERTAAAACKVHRCGVATKRVHSMADEIRILRERLPSVAGAEPRWASRIERLLLAGDRLAASVAAPAPTGIHRDFYPDQVIVAGERLFLIDFDLYCIGDPAVDIGNFLGHLVEQALRTKGDPAAYSELEAVFAGRFYALAGPETRHAVEAYRDLTLMRHIHLSTLFEDRRPFTSALLEMCEERLSPWI